MDILVRIITYFAVPLIIGFVKKGSLNGKQQTVIAVVWAFIASVIIWGLFSTGNIYGTIGAIIGGTISGAILGDIAIYLASKPKTQHNKEVQSTDDEKEQESVIEEVGTKNENTDYVYNLSEILRAGGYKSTDYQAVLTCMRNSDKYKDFISEYATGVYIKGDMTEILSDLKTLMTDYQKRNSKEKIKKDQLKNENIKQDVLPEKQLRQLKELYDEGVLTEEEFKEKKRMLLGI